ncbi:NAD(P)H-dependent glycerol-3-phosphate dehydrogenase [Rhodobacterales bacterium HKCCE3408]|nr:NAD(P)H-dependent glycerol-3-phosphate dehydrogenase [Rhodobacterales bacterium HKCCE3408]
MSGRIDVLGAGAFGTALAIALARAGREVRLWARSGADEMQATRRVPRLPDADLPEGVTVTGDRAALDAPIRLIAVPTQQIETVLEDPAPAMVSCAKGIHRATGLGPASLITARCPEARVAQLTGPGFATDIAAGLPTAMTLASPDEARDLQEALSTPALRLYRSTDVIGAELGGALKNVYAIAAGAAMAGGLGLSARAALIARGFAEMTRIATAAGAEPETLAGLSGLGDLVLTCTSDVSRNYRFGAALATGADWDPGVTVEGRATAAALSARTDVDTPVADMVDALAEGRIDFETATDTLLNRPLKAE